jgi:hypothetical protein
MPIGGGRTERGDGVARQIERPAPVGLTPGRRRHLLVGGRAGTTGLVGDAPRLVDRCLRGRHLLQRGDHGLGVGGTLEPRRHRGELLGPLGQHHREARVLLAGGLGLALARRDRGLGRHQVGRRRRRRVGDVVAAHRARLAHHEGGGQGVHEVRRAGGVVGGARLHQRLVGDPGGRLGLGHHRGAGGDAAAQVGGRLVVAGERVERGPRRQGSQRDRRGLDGGRRGLVGQHCPGPEGGGVGHGAGQVGDAIGHGHPLQQGGRLRGLAGRRLGRHRGRPQTFERGLGLVEPGAQRAQRRHPRLRLGPRLRGGPLELGGGGGRGLGRRAGDGVALAGGLGHQVVEAETEQAHEQVLPVARHVVEEAGEVALGQRHARGELPEVETEQLGDGGGDLLGVARQQLAVGDSLEARLLGAGAALRVDADDTHGRVGGTTDGEVEPDPRLDPAL